MLLKDAQFLRINNLNRVITPVKTLNSYFLRERSLLLSEFHGLRLQCASKITSFSSLSRNVSIPISKLEEMDKAARSRQPPRRNFRNSSIRNSENEEMEGNNGKDAVTTKNLKHLSNATTDEQKRSNKNFKNDLFSKNNKIRPPFIPNSQFDQFQNEKTSANKSQTDSSSLSTSVPRPSYLKDDEWTQADIKVVRAALHESERLVSKLTPSKLNQDVSETVKSSPVKSNQFLLGRSLEELQQLAMDFEEQKYRGKQLYQFIYKNKGSDLTKLEMLPKKFRSDLMEAGIEIGRLPVHFISAANDGTAKLLLKLEDNRLVETVGIPSEERSGGNRLTACISSQVGCPLKCSFCATGKGGFARNLKPHEIISQVLAIEELFQHRVNNVVFMGMGEPMLNLPSVLIAQKCLNKDLGIGQRMITISTVGVPNTIKRFAEHKLQSTLAISLHAPNQGLRETLVPSAKSYPLDALMKDCQQYFQITNRRVSFEYTLLAGVNDQVSHANELADLLYQYNLAHHVNLIPFNPISDSDFRRPSKAYVLQFLETLTKRKVNASVRQTRGMEANAACGQLRNDFQKNPINTME